VAPVVPLHHPAVRNTFLFGSSSCCPRRSGLPPRIATPVPGRAATCGLLKALCDLGYVVEAWRTSARGAHISYWKHTSAWETMAQMLIFPPQSWVLKREIM